MAHEAPKEGKAKQKGAGAMKKQTKAKAQLRENQIKKGKKKQSKEEEAAFPMLRKACQFYSHFRPHASSTSTSN